MPTHDRLHRRAVLAFRRSVASRWVTAHDASKIVGSYDRGATLALASDLRVSVDQVENYALAYSFYDFLRGHFRPRSEVRRLRKELTLTHFYRLGRLQPTIELDPAEWVEYLQFAEQNGVSAAGLAMLISDAHEADPRPDWQRRLASLLTGVRRAVDWESAPEEFKAWYEQGRRWLDA